MIKGDLAHGPSLQPSLKANNNCKKRKQQLYLLPPAGSTKSSYLNLTAVQLCSFKQQLGRLSTTRHHPPSAPSQPLYLQTVVHSSTGITLKSPPSCQQAPPLDSRYHPHCHRSILTPAAVSNLETTPLSRRNNFEDHETTRSPPLSQAPVVDTPIATGH